MESITCKKCCMSDETWHFKLLNVRYISLCDKCNADFDRWIRQQHWWRMLEQKAARDKYYEFRAATGKRVLLSTLRDVERLDNELRIAAHNVIDRWLNTGEQTPTRDKDGYDA